MTALSLHDTRESVPIVPGSFCGSGVLRRLLSSDMPRYLTRFLSSHTSENIRPRRINSVLSVSRCRFLYLQV